MDLIVSVPIHTKKYPYVKALTPNLTVFRDRVLGGNYSQMIKCLNVIRGEP